MDLTVIMVNYKCDRKKLNTCLNSIIDDIKVLIIDHSKDLEINQIIVPKNISLEIIENENLGNGAGINCGINKASTKYVLYLDIDTILPKNFFLELKNIINKIDTFAVIAPQIDKFYDYKKIKNFGNLSLFKFFYNKLFFNIKREKDLLDNVNQVFFVSGSIMLINKEITLKNNIKFDENIFLFYEEDDFFHQCFKANLKIYLINDLKAIHLDGSISDNTLKFECFKKWHWEWSKYYFLNKHYNKLIIFLLALKNIFKISLKICLFYFYNKKKKDIYKSRLDGIIGFYLKKSCKINY